MKKKFQKMVMVVAAVVLFVGVMLLNVEKNDQDKWKFAAIASFAQGGDEAMSCPEGEEKGYFIQEKVGENFLICVEGVQQMCDKWRHSFEATPDGEQCGVDGAESYQSHECVSLGIECS